MAEIVEDGPTGPSDDFKVAFMDWQVESAMLSNTLLRLIPDMPDVDPPEDLKLRSQFLRARRALDELEAQTFGCLLFAVSVEDLTTIVVGLQGIEQLRMPALEDVELALNRARNVIGTLDRMGD